MAMRHFLGRRTGAAITASQADEGDVRMSKHFKQDWTPRQDAGGNPHHGGPGRNALLVLAAAVLLVIVLGAAIAHALSGTVVDAQTEWNYKNNGEKVVYLTFDDGPSKNTQRVLDILDQYGAKATFFVVGHDPDHYDMIKKAYDDGNTIGLHSYTHDYAKVYASENAYFDDLDQIAQVVKDQIGFVPYLVRFPGGSSNTISEKYCSGIMDALVNDVQARGYQYYDWNASSGDGAVCTTDQIIQNSCAYDDYPNIILLCHDAATKDTTVEALPKIIEHYQALGYQFKAIDRSTMVPHHRVAN